MKTTLPETSAVNEINQLESVFLGNSAMAAAMRKVNWDNSLIGPVSEWSVTLKTSLRLILTSSYPMFVWWGEELVVFYNDAYMTALGSKHPNALGRPGKEVWAEIWNKIGPLMERVMYKGETIFEEKSLFLMERNGFKEETYYTYSYSPIIEEDGKISGVFCSCYEDTPQVLSERRLNTIASISGISTDISTDAARTEVLAAISENPNDFPFALLYKVTDGEIILDNYTETAFSTNLFDEPALLNGSFCHLDKIQDLISVEIPCCLKNMLKLPSHGVLPKWAMVIPVKEVGKNLVTGYLVTGISPILPFDGEYLKFLKLLSAQLNATATSIKALEQERLLSKKLLELDKAKTDFFSNISHEFRTPLTLIMGPLEVLLSKADSFSDEDRESLQIMQRNGIRLLKQVNTLLNFSFVEAGKYKASFVATDLAKLTSELASTFRSVMQQAGLEYTIACEAVSEPVYIDAEIWEIIVLNLLSNAYKFTLSGSISIELAETEKGAELHVRDTGVGIPHKDLPHLFERFHRVEQNAGRSIDGSGIGLALVAELVKLQGGSIRVLSEVGNGSHFIVSIPKGVDHLPQDRVGAVADADKKVSTLKTHQPDGLSWLISGPQYAASIDKPARTAINCNSNANLPVVLLVDDNPDMLNYVARLIEKDYRVLTAANGQQALNVMEQQKPDLILSDIMMPVMDGVTLLNKLRSIPEYVSIPVILLSARAGNEDKFRGFNTGADDYLVKPFSASELITRINSNIRNAKQRNEWQQKEQSLLKDTAHRKQLLESILSSISDAFYLVDNDLEFVYVNNRALEITNKTREEHIGKKVLDVYPYLADSKLYKKILESMRTLQPVAMEYYDKMLDRWFDCRLHPGPAGSSAYFADITDRKLEEQAHSESEKRFWEVANAAPVLIWMSDTDMLCHFFNNKWLEFRGRTMEEEYGNGWVEGVHPDDVEACMQIYTSAFKAGKTFSMEYRLLNKDGEYRWLLDNGIPRFTEQGQFLGYIGACTDITERKWAEAVVDNYNKELVERVELRTRELMQSNAQLKKEIEEKKRRKQELIRSHEQLQSLTSYLQDLRENERKLIAREIHDDLGQALSAFKIEISLLYDRVADSRSKYKDTMLDSLKSMEQALDESLASMRRIITKLRPSMSDDLELVYEIQRLVADLGKRLGISIEVRSEVENIEIEAHIAIEVFRVIQESVTNIIKHARASAATIEITKEQDKFRFLVSDNGVGFNEEELAGKQTFGIMGIKERAQRIGASLDIDSCPGKGTTVELLIDATTQIKLN